MAALNPGQWYPKPVRDMVRLNDKDLSKIPEEVKTFSLDFLVKHFKASEWSIGIYWACNKSARQPQAFYIIDPSLDPFAPSQFCQHGAKLVPFFNEDEGPDDLDNCPLFVQVHGSEEDKMYAYLGHYTQTRFSDYLDFDTMSNRVPPAIKTHWAKYLSSTDRPKWVTDALKEHFFPPPAYEGPFDSKSLKEHCSDLRQWSKESSAEVKQLTEKEILTAFEAAEEDEPRGLRLAWEYLECVGYDHRFYNTLAEKASPRPNAAAPPIDDHQSSSQTTTNGWDMTGPSREQYEEVIVPTAPSVRPPHERYSAGCEPQHRTQARQTGPPRVSSMRQFPHLGQADPGRGPRDRDTGSYHRGYRH